MCAQEDEQEAEEEVREDEAPQAPEEVSGEAPRGVGVRSIAAMEFLKWFFLSLGIAGFIGWLGNMTSGPIFYGLYEYTIAENIPVANIAFGVILLLGCAVAAKQRSSEIRARDAGLEGRLDEANHNLAMVSGELSENMRKLSREMGRAKRLSDDLETAKDTVAQQRTKIRSLTAERDKLDAELKVTQEKLVHALAPDITEVKGIGAKTADRLREMGIRDVIDLLKTSPDELATRTEVPPKVIAKWFEQAVALQGKAGG